MQEYYTFGIDSRCMMIGLIDSSTAIETRVRARMDINIGDAMPNQWRFEQVVGWIAQVLDVLYCEFGLVDVVCYDMGVVYAGIIRSSWDALLALGPSLFSESLINSLILMTFYLNTVIAHYFIATAWPWSITTGLPVFALWVGLWDGYILVGNK